MTKLNSIANTKVVRNATLSLAAVAVMTLGSASAVNALAAGGNSVSTPSPDVTKSVTDGVWKNGVLDLGNMGGGLQGVDLSKLSAPSAPSIDGLSIGGTSSLGGNGGVQYSAGGNSGQASAGGGATGSVAGGSQTAPSGSGSANLNLSASNNGQDKPVSTPQTPVSDLTGDGLLGGINIGL
jgi:hypothetical protein